MAVAARVQNLPKAPPHSIEAEQSVLGGIMLSVKCWEVVEGLLHPEDFYRTDHQLIFAACAEMLRAGKAVDFVTLTEHLRNTGKLEEAGGAGYLGSLAADTYSLANVESYAKIVKERASLRGLIALGADIGDLGYRPDGRTFGQLANIAEQRLYALHERGREMARAMTFAEVLDAADKAVILAKEKRAAGGMLGAPTGIPALDKRIGGMCPGKLVVIAARPGLGKSALLNAIAMHASRHGHGGLVCSLEMDEEELGTRALAANAGVNVTRLAFGAREEHDRALEAAGDLAALPLWVDTETYTLSAICAQMTHHRRQHGITWAAVDHIGLVETDEDFRSRNDQLGHVTRTLKKMAKKLGIAVVALSQLNRAVEKERRRPTLSDLRDSGNTEQDANICLFLHTESDDNSPVVAMQFGLLKNRGGRKGWLKERITFDGATQRFAEEASYYDDEPPPSAPAAAARPDRKRAAGGDGNE